MKAQSAGPTLRVGAQRLSSFSIDQIVEKMEKSFNQPGGGG
jgi:hypothetical protein